ncbi:MAG: hypothetical protein U0802_13235 [Candidatus Binatia bacterium]
MRAAADAPALWAALLERAGPTASALLGARDTLRLEAALPLYGHELGLDTSPYEARLGWVVRPDKGLRRPRGLLAAAARRYAAAWSGSLTAPGVPRGPNTACCATAGRWACLHQRHQVADPWQGIALGYVEPAASAVGTLAVEIRGRAVAAQVVSLPFCRRGAA